MNDDGTFIFGSYTEKEIGPHTAAIYDDGHGNRHYNVRMYIIRKATLQEYLDDCQRTFGKIPGEQWHNGHYYLARTD